jgi:hypothetical protein
MIKKRVLTKNDCVFVEWGMFQDGNDKAEPLQFLSRVELNPPAKIGDTIKTTITVHNKTISQKSEVI